MQVQCSAAVAEHASADKLFGVKLCCCFKSARVHSPHQVEPPDIRGWQRQSSRKGVTCTGKGTACTCKCKVAPICWLLSSHHRIHGPDLYFPRHDSSLVVAGGSSTVLPFCTPG